MITDADGDTANASLSIEVSDSTVKPAAMTFATSDAALRTSSTATDSKPLAEGVTLTQDAVDAVNAQIAAGENYGQFSLSGGSLVFTQSAAYAHASGEESKTFDTVSFAVTDANGNATTLDVTV